MANLDVTDVLMDPDFASTMTIIRTHQSVNTGGMSVSKEYMNEFIGVVQPASGQHLQRLPEGSRIGGAIRIFTTYKLTAGRAGLAADVVGWAGNRYTVRDVQAWPYASGYVDAVCEVMPLTGGTGEEQYEL